MKLISFVFLVLFAYADISSAVLKIKEIQKSKKVFLNFPTYNVFVDINPIEVGKVEIVKPQNFSYKLKLYAIFNKQVNINGKWKREGDFINGYKIVKIMPSYVILKKENKIKILKFSTNFIKVSK